VRHDPAGNRIRSRRQAGYITKSRLMILALGSFGCSSIAMYGPSHAELSRLGRSTAEVIALVNALIQRNIRLITIKQNLDIQQQDMNSKIIITLFSLFSELERDLISLRTKEA
jgi:hypothetical protein